MEAKKVLLITKEEAVAEILHTFYLAIKAEVETGNESGVIHLLSCTENYNALDRESPNNVANRFCELSAGNRLFERYPCAEEIAIMSGTDRTNMDYILCYGRNDV